jgi:hypothetical protein
MLGGELPGRNNVLTKPRDEAVVGLDRRGEVLGPKREQRRMRGVEHRVIGAAARAVGVAGLEQDARA